MSNNLAVTRLLATPIKDIVTDEAQLTELRLLHEMDKHPMTLEGAIKRMKIRYEAFNMGTAAYSKGLRDDPEGHIAVHKANDIPVDDPKKEAAALTHESGERKTLIDIFDALLLLGGTEQLPASYKKDCEDMVRLAPQHLRGEADQLARMAMDPLRYGYTDYPVETAAGYRADETVLRYVANAIEMSIIKTFPGDHGLGPATTS